MEYMEKGCIEDLVNNIGILPENILLELANQMISAIEQYQVKTNCAYSGLFPSHLQFNKIGKLKVIILLILSAEH